MNGDAQGNGVAPVVAQRTDSTTTVAQPCHQIEQAKPKAPLERRCREFARRKAMWLPRTEENRAALVRSVRLFLEASDPDCLEQTDWAPALVEEVWLDASREEELGSARTEERFLEIDRATLFSDGRTFHPWYSPYGVLGQNNRRRLDWFMVRKGRAATLALLITGAVLWWRYRKDFTRVGAVLRGLPRSLAASVGAWAWERVWRASEWVGTLFNPPKLALSPLSATLSLDRAY